MTSPLIEVKIQYQESSIKSPMPTDFHSDMQAVTPKRFSSLKTLGSLFQQAELIRLSYYSIISFAILFVLIPLLPIKDC
jgi:hypothetical protein